MATSKLVKPHTPHPAPRKNFLPQTLIRLVPIALGGTFGNP
ncbi:MAG: hypothetical protein PX640_10590 [Microcystis sp. M49629_WE12]|nr:hypothetical protein [Microcystis sp. LE19-10.1B]MCZ8028906.1 hypothetical protein [Microcystis sp. LE19-10.1B]MCZ8364183.1 hypothetical protein [Microcystis sp. LE19-251.1A]MDJ0529831.1 hypothetical protein [Microcystis sp. M53600_WE12]MDJ0564376.1 hypothetical protein [Microcystis sp. M49629_WE12]